jgi:hypothetical protein
VTMYGNVTGAAATVQPVASAAMALKPVADATQAVLKVSRIASSFSSSRTKIADRASRHLFTYSIPYPTYIPPFRCA